MMRFADVVRHPETPPEEAERWQVLDDWEREAVFMVESWGGTTPFWKSSTGYGAPGCRKAYVVWLSPVCLIPCLWRCWLCRNGPMLRMPPMRTG